MTNRQYSQFKRGVVLRQYRSYAITALAMLIGTLILANAFVGALEKSESNKHQMLCNSARVSGNDYINNCK